MRLRLFFGTYLLFFCGYSTLHAQQNVTLSGYVRDASNGEALIGATIYLKEHGGGNATNVYGFYSLTIPPGTYEVVYSYVGYTSQTQTIQLTSSQRLDVELNQEEKQLDEVIITGDTPDDELNSVDMSTEKLNIQTIRKMPALLGEVDVLKSIQLLPGVSTVGEGSSGFNVRGGGVGQNLVLLDEAPVYNSSHLFGFFSVFNPDAVKDVNLIKGAMPAQYGGRISSILDVRMNEGNSKEFEVTGGVGTVFSRLAVQGPIKKDKASFLVAGRRSYVDIFARPATNDATLYFYDLTAKVNYNLNKNNRFYLSGYFGRDVFKFDKSQGFDWGNVTTTLRWNHLFNDRLFSNVSAYVSKFDYGFSFGDSDLDRFDWDSRILTYSVKPQFTYFINTRNELSFGGEATYYDFKPAKAIGVSDGVTQDISLEEKYGLETAVYVDNTSKLTSQLSVRYGARLSSWSYLGPGMVYAYLPGQPGEHKPLDPEHTYRVDHREPIATYTNLEPRLSANYRFGRSSVKASYARTAQYIHLISNTAASTPIDVWTPSTNNIRPQLGDQYAVGYFRNFEIHNQYEASVEAYYRNTREQVEYVKGAELFINPYLEGEIIQGDGRAYGLEFNIKKNTGQLTGWVSYTLGRTELQVEGINKGEWYPTRFDQTHNLKIYADYEVSDRVSVSANFTLLSGTPITAPTSRFEQQGLVIPYNYYNDRNNFRIPSSHRLDLSLTWQQSREKKGKKRKNQDYLVFSLYNVYARKNPFSIFFAQSDERAVAEQPIETMAYKFSILGSIVPAISYNFKF